MANHTVDCEHCGEDLRSSDHAPGCVSKQRFQMDRDKLKEKIRQALRAKAEDFPPDSTARHFLWSHSYEAAEAALTAIEDAGCVIAPKEPMRSEDVFTGDDVENIAEWQEWASRTGNDQLAGMLRHWWKKAQKTAEALRSLKRLDKTESENGVCQADAGIKGETVSREGALQAAAGGDAGIWTREMKAAAMQDAQNVCDLSMIMRRMLRRIEKGLPLDDLASKAEDFMRRKGLNGSVLRGMNEEAQRADTERPASAEGSLTQINQDTDNG